MNLDPLIPESGPPPTVSFEDDSLAEQLVHILDHYLGELKAGRKPDRAALLAEHPQLAKQLEACLAGLEFIQGVESTNAEIGLNAKSEIPTQHLLGDFRILKEVGRGGMGVVYEAEQVSLGRRVALKVLRFAGVSDPEALDRFRREAETVAGLHHTNIVPIFAVGCDQGVNFFAMQFIQGLSLAEVQSNAKEPLNEATVMQWGLQAAEALTHAHERNIIHRDVKPSNLLLDQEGRIWLTDFGLARRLDDVSMSRTGAMLGTPRYMSPEQASASRQQVDRRTDVYSLGATLYELLAGQPVFSGDTAHRVIQQILLSEPTPLRMLRPKLPRDLETVVMKCLKKGSEDRYHSARELADDLRACLELRPIRARRAGWTEQVLRWLRSRRQGVRISSYAVGATLLLVVMFAFGWSWYESSRLVPLLLTTKTPPLSAEFIDSRGNSVVTASVPSERPILLRDGGYELRVSSPDRWSQTFTTSVQHNDQAKREMDIEDQQLWSPTVASRWWSLVDDTDSAALLLWNDDGVVCESGVPKKQRWKRSFKDRRPDALLGASGLLWPWFKGPESAHHSMGPTRHAPVAASKTIDVDNDGNGDFIVAGHHQAFVMALSGLDGTVLWCAAQGQDVRQEIIDSQDQSHISFRSTIVGSPIIVGDHDEDGVPDVLVTCADTGIDPLVPRLVATGGGSVVDALRWVELLSGATGKSIWKRDLPNESFQLAPGERVPSVFQWIVGSGFGVSSSNVGGNWTLKRHIVRWGRESMKMDGIHAYLPEPASVIQGQGKEIVAIVAGQRIECLETKTGRTVVGSEMTARPGCGGRWTDMDGDGESEYVFLERVLVAGNMGAFRAEDTAQLIVWNVRAQKALWSKPLQAKFPIDQELTVSPPNWPLIEDLDQDGLPEVIIPVASSALTSMNFGAVPWGELAVLDGKTGKSRWRQRIVNLDQQVDNVSTGPDINGDGHRDVFVASLANRPTRLFVEARSGKSGETLWITPSEIRSDVRLQNRIVGSLQWWNAGEDGWPQLVVTLQGEVTSPLESDGFVYSASTGRMTRMRHQVSNLLPIDVDHDGVQDLVTYRATELSRPEDGGTIDCVRGMAAEPWNRLGVEGSPSADFNGDGIRDVLRSDLQGGLAAICGRYGRKLWETKVGSQYAYEARALVEPQTSHSASSMEYFSTTSEGDIDGDGIVDILFWPPMQFGKAASMLGVVSGKTGRVIWRSSDLSVRISEGLVDYRVADLDGDGTVELVVVAIADIDYPRLRTSFSTDDLQCWLIVMSGKTGQIRWKTPLSSAYGSSPPPHAQLPPNGNTGFPVQVNGQMPRMLNIADLDGDRKFEILTPAIAKSDRNLELHAYMGSNGKAIWKHSLSPEWNMSIAFAQQTLVRVCDLDRDKAADVVFVDRHLDDATLPNNHFTLRLNSLSGATGSVQWQRDIGSCPFEMPFLKGERHGVAEIVLAKNSSGSVTPSVLLTGSMTKIVVVQGQGETTETLLTANMDAGTLWSCDTDGDGVDELVYLLNGQVKVVSLDDVAEPQWKQTQSAGRYARILETRSGTGGMAGEIVVSRILGDNSVVGLDAVTGQERWIAAAPIPRDRRNYSLPQINARLDLDPNSTKPLVMFQYNQMTHCRSASLLGRYSALFANVSEIPNYSNHQIRDPRLARGLPWERDIGMMPPVFEYVLQSAMYSVAMILLPIGYLVWMFRHMRWSVRSLLALSVIATITILVAIKNPFGFDELTSLERLIHGIVATPPMMLIMYVIVSTTHRRWDHLVVLLLGTLVTTALLAIVLVIGDKSSNPMLPGEYYAHDDWYLIFDNGMYATSILFLGVWVKRARGMKQKDE